MPENFYLLVILVAWSKKTPVWKCKTLYKYGESEKDVKWWRWCYLYLVLSLLFVRQLVQPQICLWVQPIKTLSQLGSRDVRVLTFKPPLKRSAK